MMTGDISFGEMAKRVLADPELRKLLPKRPAMNTAYRLLEVSDDHLVITGGSEMRAIRGRHTGLLMSVVRTLDGSTLLADVADRVSPATPTAALQAIAVLAYLGALEDRADDPAVADDSVERQFCSRFMSVTRANVSGAAALRRVAATTLTLAGDAPLLAGLVGRMRETNMPWRHWRRGLASRPSELLVLAEGAPQDHAEAVQWAADAGVGVLHVGAIGGSIHWGPLWQPASATQGYAAYRQLVVSGELVTPPLSDWWQAFVVHQIFLHVSRLIDCRIVDAYLEYDAGRPWTAMRRQIVYPPALAAANRGDAPSSATAALWHHGSIKMPPSELITLSSHLHHYARQNIALGAYAPLGDRAIREDGVALPAHGAAEVARAAERYATGGGPLPVAVLANALWLSCGYQRSPEGRPRRVAPTGGGLCSPAAFVAVRDCEGLDPGIYRYCFRETARLERWADLDENVLAGALGLNELQTPAYVVVAGRLGRVMQKYHDFAYNVVHYDAGVAKAYIARVLSTLGVPYAELTGIHTAACSAALGIAAANDLTVAITAIEVGQRVLCETQATARDGSLRSLVRAATKVMAPAPAGPAPAGDVSGLALPELTRLLAARRSVRSFAPSPLISAGTVTTLLAAAREADARCRAQGGLPFTVRCYAMVNGRTVASGSGVYSLDDAGAELIHQLPLELDDVERRYVNQLALGAAPVKVVTAIDLPDLVQRFGAAGYREALVRAGHVVAAVWMRALEIGLAGVAAGGFIENAWIEVLSRAAQPVTSTLVGFACGYEAPPTEGTAPEMPAQ